MRHRAVSRQNPGDSRLSGRRHLCSEGETRTHHHAAKTSPPQKKASEQATSGIPKRFLGKGRYEDAAPAVCRRVQKCRETSLLVPCCRNGCQGRHVTFLSLRAQEDSKGVHWQAFLLCGLTTAPKAARCNMKPKCKAEPLSMLSESVGRLQACGCHRMPCLQPRPWSGSEHCPTFRSPSPSSCVRRKAAWARHGSRREPQQASSYCSETPFLAYMLKFDRT